MSRKIVGVTVGTPLSPAKIEEKISVVKTVNGISPDENGNVVVEQISEERFTTLEEVVDGIVADLNYKAIDITKFTNTASGTHELGTMITEYTLAWTLNKEPVSQTLDGVSIGADVRSVTETDLKITNNKTFTLKVTDERGATDTASTTINFLKGVYYGVLENGATINTTAVQKLTRNLRSNHMPSFTVNAGATQRIAYAHPTNGFNAPVFNVGGFEGGFSKASTFQFTNASGHTESYDVWLSDNVGLGSTTVKVT